MTPGRAGSGRLRTDAAEPGGVEFDLAYLAAIIESSHDAIVSKSLDGIITSWNAGAERLFGYKAAEVVGLPINFLFPEGREAEEVEILRRLGRGEKVDHFESIRLTRDGRLIEVSLTISPIRDRSGNIIGISKIARDITARKQAERLHRAAEVALRKRECEFETLTENSPLIIARFDPDMRHVYVNRAVEDATGLPRGAFLGRTNRELGMPADLCDYWEGRLRSAIAGRVQTDCEFSFLTPSGRASFHSRLVPEFDPEGRVTSVLAVSEDVTERKALQAELLSIAEREQGRIGRDLHDDVGQELTGVGLMAETLAEALDEAGSPEAPLAARICERLGHARRKVQAMVRVLIPVEVDALGLEGALRELSAKIGPQLGIEFDCRCEVRPTIDDDRMATQLYRIAQEAVANAVRHGQARRVVIALRGDGAEVTLEVRDDGVGIGDESRDGGGMGLKILRYRAGLLGATLEVGPAEGGGTRVACRVERRHHDAGTPRSAEK